jgi:hypothetical protein
VNNGQLRLPPTQVPNERHSALVGAEFSTVSNDLLVTEQVSG